jgi:hypothetical protein
MVVVGGWLKREPVVERERERERERGEVYQNEGEKRERFLIL